MRNLTLFVIGMLLIPTLSAAENEEIVKLLLCYNSPKSDYCLAEHITKLFAKTANLQKQLNSKIADLQKQLNSKTADLQKQLNSKTANLQKQLNSKTSDLQKQLNNKTAKLQQQIDSQQQQINKLLAEVIDLKAQQIENRRQIKLQQKQLEIQNQQIKSLSGKYADNHERITQQNGQFDSFQNIGQRISTLESRLYRYTDNNDGTVTDNRTSLIWLKNANCFNSKSWKTAKKKVANLASSQCGLRDNSKANEWRLPTKNEWKTLMDYRYRQLTLSNALGTGQWKEGDAFSKVQLGKYWSSSSNNKSTVWYANIYDGDINSADTSNKFYVWPIKNLTKKNSR